MEYIRIIHKMHYDHRKQNFKSLAFKNSSVSKGISVISKNCIEESGKHVCEHISEFYITNHTASIPPIYWQFSLEHLPGCLFKQYPSNSGDECHGDIVGLQDSAARTLLKNNAINGFNICTDGGFVRPLDLSDLENM